MSESPAVAGQSQEASKKAKTPPPVKTPETPEQVRQMIAVTAYYRAEGRNFEPGHELEDWLAAEAELLADMEGLKGSPA